LVEAKHQIAYWEERNKPTLKSQSEPVLVVTKEPDYWSGGHFHTGRRPYIDPFSVYKLAIGTKLYTAPQPSAEVEKDAARYRWLREQHDVDLPIGRVVWKKGSLQTSSCWCDLIDGFDLDAHIDAAMQAKGTQK
jgi:hypothetical protein